MSIFSEQTRLFVTSQANSSEQPVAMYIPSKRKIDQFIYGTQTLSQITYDSMKKFVTLALKQLGKNDISFIEASDFDEFESGETIRNIYSDRSHQFDRSSCNFSLPKCAVLMVQGK
jgi:hypothetical protein